MFSLDIDSVIFLVFLVINVFVGLYYARDISSIKEYAVGNGSFSALTIAATLVATCISGSSFFNRITEAYNNGLYDVWATSGVAVSLLIIGYFFAPRLGEFLGKLSIADAMGGLYGNKVRVITAIAGCIAAGGIIAVQLKVAGRLIEYGFGVPSIYGVVIAACIVGFYSSFGGIKSVTFTDILQLFTFGTIIPTLAFFIFSNLDGATNIVNMFKHNELFDYKKIFDFSYDLSMEYLLLFLFFLIPDFNPAIFQRVSMAKNTIQVQQSFSLAGFTYLIIICTLAFIGMLVLGAKPGLDSKDLIKHIILDYSYVGLKGLTLAGVMAMVMSTADSFINSTAVLLVHDVCKPLKITAIKKELNVTRLASVFITIFAFCLTLTEDNLRKLMVATSSFYFPIVSMPFMFSVFGFRTSTKSVLIAMAAGFSCIVIWKLILKNSDIESAVLAVAINCIFLLGSHYLLKQPGGWVGIKDESYLISLKQQRRRNIAKFFYNLRHFNFFNFLKSSTSKSESSYIAVGIFCIIATYAAVFTLPENISSNYQNIIDVIYPSMLFSATALLSYPLWPVFIKRSNTIVVVWNLVIFYILICTCFFFAMISNFASIQLTLFMINLILISILLRWELSLLMIIVGTVITYQFLNYYAEEYILRDELQELKFKAGYLLLLISGILVAFLKPKQEAEALKEAKNSMLAEQMDYKDEELIRSMAIKQEFINNIGHEIRTPLTSITNIGRDLYEVYKDLSPAQLESALQNISESSERLESFVNNILDLSNLSTLNYKLNLSLINLRNLVLERVQRCKKLYLEEKELEIIVNVSDISCLCDRHYIAATLDNLIINAIKYSNIGQIIINLEKKDNEIMFSIKDQGIGVPQAELQSIFSPFVESSKTKSNAKGRGLGLSLCKKAVELHGGKIWAKSNETDGSAFYFTLRDCS
jgi:Na+/proline symporter/signal transduction histidine kinase